MSRDTERPSVRFEPLRPASRGRLLAAIICGPIIWLVALVAAAWLFVNSWLIQLGFLVALASFLLALLVLALLRQGRLREERRYADRS